MVTDCREKRLKFVPVVYVFFGKECPLPLKQRTFPSLPLRAHPHLLPPAVRSAKAQKAQTKHVPVHVSVTLKDARWKRFNIQAFSANAGPGVEMTCSSDIGNEKMLKKLCGTEFMVSVYWYEAPFLCYMKVQKKSVLEKVPLPVEICKWRWSRGLETLTFGHPSSITVAQLGRPSNVYHFRTGSECVCVCGGGSKRIRGTRTERYRTAWFKRGFQRVKGRSKEQYSTAWSKRGF